MGREAMKEGEEMGREAMKEGEEMGRGEEERGRRRGIMRRSGTWRKSFDLLDQRRSYFFSTVSSSCVG